MSASDRHELDAPQAPPDSPREGQPPQAGPVANGRWKRLHPRWITTKRIEQLFVLLVLGVPTLIAALLMVGFGMLEGVLRWLPLALWLLLIAWLTWLATGFPPLAYRFARYRVTPEPQGGVEIRRGVIWRHVINVPRSRVQHTDVIQGPIQRHYGLGTLLMHTAGTHNATVTLPGLPHEKAMAIRDYLIHENGDVVNEAPQRHSEGRDDVTE